MANFGESNYTGMKPLESERRSLKSNSFWIEHMNQQFVICIENKGYDVSLEKRKLYEVLPDRQAEALGQLRVKDESGEDYLYPKEFFIAVTLPASAEKAIIEAA
jgi:hypothetical protein